MTSQMATVSRTGHGSETTFVTVSDRRFFLGTVGLVNSLRLVGHDERILILDAGLTTQQRSLLESTCEVLPVPVELTGAGRDSQFGRALYKPYVRAVDPAGVLVFVDSDMIVTATLIGLIEEAKRGRICAFPAESALTRRFAEWESIFALSAVPRHQVYVNAGLVVVSVSRWPNLVDRWWEACLRFPVEHAKLPADLSLAKHPLALYEQDALNAILMSEIPEGVLAVQDPDLAATTHHRDKISILDARELVCFHRGKQTVLLHHLGREKPWEPAAWRRLRFKAYTTLLSRLLTGVDVPLRPPSASLPIWLRPGLRSRAPRPVLRVLSRVIRPIVLALPPALQRRLVALGRAEPEP